MNRLFRKLRGLLGVGLTWGTLWAGIGAGIGVVVGIVSPEAWRWGNPIIEWAFGIGMYGFVSGVGFGTLLSLRESSKKLLDISLRRAASWGVLGAAAVPFLFFALGTFETGVTMAEILGAVLVTAGLGGVFAPASIAAWGMPPTTHVSDAGVSRGEGFEAAS